MATGAECTEYVTENNDVTELVFFPEHTANEAEAEALRTVKGLDGCLRYVLSLQSQRCVTI